ncbi:uncharacterized protein EI90DRAFT_3117117 [Cantharellus anzutake]|uniref:uncharacterized protein n=1 Tax=Cantharellus anzutake TaxID=1750568 RepID=UPI001908CA7A|nr:uncharacterized protein EI90DRAFT_3117117 [Cantharellus anzutake]KAF8340609.1 hypothetical protein EI90DRAFT_3117117 [Cantharellus anzutake]
MEKNPYLDPAAQAFLEEFRFGLSSVRDVSAELDHRVKALKAIGGFSSVYATDWAPPGAETIRVCYKELRPLSSSMPEQINQTRKLMKHLTHEVKIWKELRHPNILEFIGYAIAANART